MESADASPALSRAVATALSPVLKAAANTRNKADGGQLLELNKLQETAGADAAERWLTAALLASLENEVSELEPRAAAPQSFREREDELATEEGIGFAGLGVGLALVTIVAQNVFFGGGGDGGGGGVVDGFPTI